MNNLQYNAYLDYNLLQSKLTLVAGYINTNPMKIPILIPINNPTRDTYNYYNGYIYIDIHDDIKSK